MMSIINGNADKSQHLFSLYKTGINGEKNQGGKFMSKKYVYLFREGNADMRNLLGGKGANLAEMTNLGLPVPQPLLQ
jgi:hypothetical protein